MAQEVLGQTVGINVPEGAVITGVVVYAAYQRIGDEGQAQGGEIWGASSMTRSQAVGLARVCGTDLERAYDIATND